MLTLMKQEIMTTRQRMTTKVGKTIICKLSQGFRTLGTLTQTQTGKRMIWTVKASSTLCTHIRRLHFIQTCNRLEGTLQSNASRSKKLACNLTTSLILRFRVARLRTLYPCECSSRRWASKQSLMVFIRRTPSQACHIRLNRVHRSKQIRSLQALAKVITLILLPRITCLNLGARWQIDLTFRQNEIATHQNRYHPCLMKRHYPRQP